MILRFENKALGLLSLKVTEENVLTQLEALIKLGFEPEVVMEEPFA